MGAPLKPRQHGRAAKGPAAVRAANMRPYRVKNTARFLKRCRMTVQDDRVAAFRHLHSSGCFVMPNPWDVGTARALEQMGFQALATTSAGFAWTLGRADNQVALDQA